VISTPSTHSPDTSRPSYTRSHRSSGSNTSAQTNTTVKEIARDGRPVVCRVSAQALRLEREFQLSKVVVKKSDPECKHFLRPVEFVRLPSKAGEEQLVASIFEAPGPNYLKDMVTFGPNWFTVTKREESWQSHTLLPSRGIPLLTFLGKYPRILSRRSANILIVSYL
jgi:ribosomal protein L28